MNKNTTNINDIVAAVMGAVNFGPTVDVATGNIVEHGGAAHRRAADEFREQLEEERASAILEAYSDGITHGEWHISQAAANRLIGEAHLAGVESTVRLLRTAELLEGAWAEFGIESEVDLGALERACGASLGGLPLTEARFAALIAVEWQNQGFGGSLRACAEQRTTFAASLIHGRNPVDFAEAVLAEWKADPAAQARRAPGPLAGFIG